MVNLTRRRLLQAAVAAPFVITTPGLLMPVRKIWTPADEWESFVVTRVMHDELNVVRIDGHSLHKVVKALDLSMSHDQAGKFVKAAKEFSMTCAGSFPFHAIPGDIIRIKVK